ncbi:lipopolysaccharide biosynthesis protein [Salinicoccus albus]|uniref:lipopolysaccharide biosynthesis protein n=1 Tax=Salinicoccus albus TaxID=418756 RepID=UPI0003655B50|nr:hypothetical protein [Salinicoccus albus]
MNKILKNISYVFTANISNALSKFLIVILIANILTELELGVYTFAMALTAPVTLLFNMKMRSYIIASTNINYYKFLRLRNLANLLAILLINLIAITFYNEIFYIILLVGIIKIIEINSEFYQSFPNREKIFEQPAKIMMGRIIFSTLVFYITLKITQNLAISLIFQLLALLLFLFLEKRINLSLVNYKNYNYPIDIKQISLLLLPLGIVQALMSFSSNIPKYLLEIIGSFEEVGVLAATLYIVTIFNLVMSTITQTLLPYMKNVYEQNVYKFNITLNYGVNIISLIIGFIFLGIFYLIGEKLLIILYSAEFADHTYLLYIFSFVITFNISGWVYDSALLLSGAIKYQPYILVVISLITFIVAYFLIYHYGLFGAGVTVLLFNALNTLSKALYYNLKMR